MPSRADLQRALKLIRRRAEYEYFFSRLSSSSWIDPIREEGLFRSPPEPIRMEDQIQYPGWPESAYLARVASEAPKKAASVLAEMPLTDNVRVHQDLIDIALQLDPSDAAKWAAKETQWIGQQQWLFLLLPTKLAKLAVFLLRHGFERVALEMVKVIFAIRPDPRAGERSRESELRLPPTPIGKMDPWQYGEALEAILPDLARSLREPALSSAADLLQNAIDLSRLEDDPNPPTDYSFIWRDRIESSSEHRQDIRDVLVSAVRDVAEVVAAEIGCVETIKVLEARRWDVFRRVSLHVLRSQSCLHSELTRERLVNRPLFNDSAVHHEYATLLHDRFPELSEPDRSTVLSWIADGPDVSSMRDRHRMMAGEDASPDLVRGWVERWQRDRLSPIKDSLPPEWRQRFDEYVKRYGEPILDFQLYRTEVRWGEPNRAGLERIAELTGDELRELLRDWRPAVEPGESSRAGAVQALSSLSNEFLAGESANASAWVDLHPDYIAALLQGFQRALEAGCAIAWDSVLDLCLSVSRARADGSDMRWAQKSVAELIVVGIDDDARSDRPTDRTRIWEIIETLLRTHARDIAGRRRVLEGGDYLTSAINDVAGRTVEAAIRFAVWIKKEDSTKGATEWRFAEQLPAVEAALRACLDLKSGVPVDARAIFGLQLGPLMWLDGEWVRLHESALFPDGQPFEKQRHAVWDTFLKYGRPSSRALEVLRNQYSLSVGGLAGNESDLDLARHLTEHIITYYWQGLVPLSADSLLNDMFGNASEKLRTHAITFVGRSLRESDLVPADPLQRLQGLIDWRIGVVNATPDVKIRRSAAAELQGFGWWFASGKFDDTWALDRLIQVLRLTGGIEPEHLVAERLLTLVDLNVKEVAEAVRLMVQSSDRYGVLGWRDEAKQLLAKLTTHQDPIVRELAKEAVDALLARGMTEFRELG